MRRRRYDVVFYMPAIGSLLSIRAPAPAGGAETQMLMLAKALARAGYEVAIIVAGVPGDLPPVVEGVRILPRPSYRRPGTAEGYILGKLSEIVLIWSSLWLAPARTVVTRCAGIQVGLIAIYARLTRRRFVYSSASVTDFDCGQVIPKRRDQFLYKLGVRLADEVVVQSEDQVRLCRQAFGVEPVLIKSLVAPAPADSPIPEAFLWVGRVAGYKRPLEYLAMARSMPEAEFWMVVVPGIDSAENRQLETDLAAGSSELPNLTILPPRSAEELGLLTSRAVASVNTSDFEGMPNVLLEAWSRGVPALALNHDPGGVIAAHGLGDFADGSFEALIELARRLWATRAERGELAARCRAYVEAHHSPTAIAERWGTILPRDSVPSPSPGALHPRVASKPYGQT